MRTKVGDLGEGMQITRMIMPFKMKVNDEWWTLPFEPKVSVSSKNQIVARKVAKDKRRGTIKERWTEGDVNITIEGTFIHKDPDQYPAAAVQKLREAVRQNHAIEIQNEMLAQLGVNYMVIEEYSLPHSKGENVQNYKITAVSDDQRTLFNKQ